MTISKSIDQAVQEMITNYTAIEKNAPADTSIGTVNRDLIDAVADLVSQGFSAIEAVRLVTSLKNDALVSADALSQIGLNYDMVQTAPTVATGVVYFQRLLVPTKIIDFPAGTIVQTQLAVDNTTIQYVTLAAARLSPSTAINPANRRYEVSAPIIALVSGSVGNVGPGAINTLATINRNIDAVMNKDATTGGADIESNDSFSTRILSKTAGSALGTEAGYISAIETNFPDVTDVVVAGPGDPAMKRNQYGDEVDVYLLGSSSQVFTDKIFVSGLSYDNLITRPVQRLTSVVGVTNGQTYPLGIDSQLTKDTGPVFGNSVRAFDKVTWISGHRPGAGQQIYAQGFYDGDVVGVQNYLNREDVRYVTLDILAKSATRQGVVIEANIAAFSGFDRTTLSNQVSIAVANGISNYTMGQDVAQSDVVALMGGVAGVDEVQIPLVQFRLSTDGISTVDDIISIERSQYARTDIVTVHVS